MALFTCTTGSRSESAAHQSSSQSKAAIPTNSPRNTLLARTPTTTTDVASCATPASKSGRRQSCPLAQHSPSSAPGFPPLLPCLLLAALFLLPADAGARLGNSRKRVIGSGATTGLAMLVNRAGYINTKYGMNIRYNGIGSGAGRQQFIASATLYCATDNPMSVEEESRLAGSVKFTMPFALEAVTLFTSLPGKPAIRLSAWATARIFQGKITTWNDPAIAALNKGVSLPKKPIRVVVRKDVSGSTYIFTNWLSKAAKNVWQLGYGGLLTWPNGFTTAAYTNGVLQTLKMRPYAITYAGTSAGLAAGFAEVSIKNKAGNYVQASQAFLLGSIPRSLPPTTASWASISLTNRDGGNVWPMTSFLYILARRDQNQNGTPAGILKAWLLYLFSSSVQPLMNNYDFAPCPPSVLVKNIAAVQTMQLASGTSVPEFS